MGDDFAAPVQGIVKAYTSGVRLARRLSKSANLTIASNALQIYDLAQGLQRSLEDSNEAITDSYKIAVRECGDSFAETLLENKSISSQLKELRIELIELLNDCQDFDDELESFDNASFITFQTQSERIRRECIDILEDALGRTAKASAGKGKAKEIDDRSQLSSMRAHTSRKPVPPPAPPALQPVQPATASPVSTASSIPTNPLSWAAAGNTWDFNQIGPSTSLATSPRDSCQSVTSSSSNPNDPARFIPKAIIDYRLSANEDFLERRRQSRINFQKEIRKSVSSIEDKRASIVSTTPRIDSPTLGFANPVSPVLSDAPVGSPIDGRNSRASLNGYDSLMTRQRSQGQTSQVTRGSRTSSLMQDFPQPEARNQRQNSDDSIFGLRKDAPASPTLSEGALGLATTLRLPGFGQGVEDGLEVVNRADLDNEKFAVVDNGGPTLPTSTASVKSVDNPMRHDSSFYKFGGFCDGARATLRGDEGFRIMKRPAGNYSHTLTSKCVKCSYEVNYNDAEKDRKLDRSGIYGNSGIRWRQKFISKCHLKTNAVDEPLYSCVFCIEEHKVVEEHDATVFFSVSQLFKHLAKHPRPLPRVTGIDVLYGRQDPNVLDFDLHFISLEPKQAEYNMMEIAQKVAARPSATAITTYHPKNSRSNSKDPEGNPTLHFAMGAHIVGITFPERFNGAWCMGYHDGERGSFPAAAIMLDLPAKEDVFMNVQSSLIAYAKWDFKPKDAKDGGWLKFSRGDKISTIGYTYQDQWCWSGQTSKGKWGLFPMTFVENLQDGGSYGSGSGSVKSGGLLSKFGSRSGGLGRKKPERSGSLTGSLKSSGSVKTPSVRAQPGLEVVVNGVAL